MRTYRLSVVLVLLTAALCLPGAVGAGSRVMIVEVAGEIQLGLAPFVERVTAEAARDGYDLIIYEINTFGGRLDAAVVIRDAIINANLPTVAFVDKRAISAGALIALSAERVYMHPQSTIGAAEPIAMGIGMSSGEVGEKVISYWRAELRATAERNDRPARVAEAFADKSIAIPDVVEEGELLTLTASQALELGIADATFRSIEEILEHENLSGAGLERPGMNTTEHMAGFLTQGLVSSILLTIALLGIFFEIRTPGFGVPGIAALIALGLFFGSRSIVNLAGWGEILLFLFGVSLLLIELFLIPGFGVVGTIGVIAILASLYLSLIGKFYHPGDIISGLKILALSFILSFVIVMIALRFLPRWTPVGRLVLDTEQTVASGFRSTPDEYERLAGLTGTALTPLRPAGTAVIDGKKYSVVTEGDFIEKDSGIRVMKIEGYRIVVERV